MTVVISELVARVKAEGLDQTTQQIKAVGESATQTARALELMAQAAAKQGGGTPGGWMEIFQKGNVQPTAAAMAQAAQEMQRTATAAQQAVQPAQNVARAAAEHATAARSGAQAAQGVAEGWKLSESSVIRFASSLVGINLGISVVAGSARLIHEEIAASVDAAVQLDRVGRTLSATYGGGAAGMTAFARGLAPAAGVSYATAEQAVSSAGPLANQFGLTTAQIQQLTTRAADLAGSRGQPFEQTFQAVLEGVQSGGTQLQQYGVRLDDVYEKTIAYNGALSATYNNMTQAQQIGVRFNSFLDQTRGLQGSAATSADTLSGSLDHLGAAWQRLREQSGAAAAGGIQGPAQALAGWLNQITGVGADTGQHAIVVDPNAPAGARVITGQPQFDVGSLPGATQPSGPQAFIGPPRPLPRNLLINQAANAQNLAGRAQAEAQAQITAIQLQSEQRRLTVAEDLAGYRTQELQVQQQMAPLLNQQASLQDRITRASRDNLDTRRQLISAEQGALGAQSITSAGQYDQNLAQAVARQRMARLLQGQDVSNLPSLDQLIQQNYRGQLIEAENAPNVVRAQRGVEVTQQQATAQDLARQQTLTDLEGQRRALEDQTTPLQEALRLTQAREASIQRALDLSDLANTAAVTSAQQALNEANTIRLIADETARIAQNFNDNMVSGATALERSASAARATRDALFDARQLIIAVDPNQAQRRINNGLGAGGLGPSSSAVNITINGADAQRIKQEAHQAVEDALNQFFGGWDAPLAPRELAGARR